MGSIFETILRRAPVEFTEEDKNPLSNFLLKVNYGLERAFGKGYFHHLEEKRLVRYLFAPRCESLGQAARAELTRRNITAPFWKRVLIFSTHEECFLNGKVNFVYDKGSGEFKLNIANVLKNAQNTWVVCKPLEWFNEQYVQTRLLVQQGEDKSVHVPITTLGIDKGSKSERTLLIIARYRGGNPQICVSPLSLNSDWKDLFGKDGKLISASSDNKGKTPNIRQIAFPREKEVPPNMITALNNALKEKGLIKANEQIIPGGIFQPQVVYTTPNALQIPVFIAARPEEIDRTRIISIADQVDNKTGNHNLQVTLNDVFKRCPKTSINVPFSSQDASALSLTLNPKAYIDTPSGHYRIKKGVIAIPFKLSALPS